MFWAWSNFALNGEVTVKLCKTNVTWCSLFDEIGKDEIWLWEQEKLKGFGGGGGGGPVAAAGGGTEHGHRILLDVTGF